MPIVPATQEGFLETGFLEPVSSIPTWAAYNEIPFQKKKIGSNLPSEILCPSGALARKVSRTELSSQSVTRMLWSPMDF
jgi:hypothetical protein